MTKYRVCVTREVTQSTYVELEADTPEEADDKAYNFVNDASFASTVLVWSLDDYAGDPYIPAPGEAEELP